MRIAMAVVASCKFDPGVLRLTIGTSLMTGLTADLKVSPGQWIPGLRVIELRGLLPIGRIVALQAVTTQLALVFIFVTTRASLR
jgi:hypothetical protein